jgi:hypothetical protein
MAISDYLHRHAILDSFFKTGWKVFEAGHGKVEHSGKRAIPARYGNTTNTARN